MAKPRHVVPAADFQKSFRKYLRECHTAPVVISKYNRVAAVLVSLHDFADILGIDKDALACRKESDLREERRKKKEITYE